LIAEKIAKDGSLVVLYPLIFGWRITLSRPGPWMREAIDDSW
jgi:hypothetical protein